jgi:hypothetical protein
VFAETQPEPTQQEISEHFDRYKKFFAGTVSDQNPYGFGYKLPDRVPLQYIAVKLDDVSGIVTPPTAEQTEEYYRKNRERYVEQIPSDPNDPNSPLIERTKSYAEVAGIIGDSLLQNKIASTANRILQEAKTLTEADLQDAGIKLENLDPEQLGQTVGNYEAVAGQLSEKHKINVYAGQTGLLSAADIGRDEQLGMLYMKGYGRNPVGLAQIVFAVDELKASELGPFDVPKPRMYENIGPFEDVLGKIMVVVRIIRAEKAVEPQSADQSYSRETIRFETGAEQTAQNIYSVKEKVAEDLKQLAAMDTTKGKAEDFIKQVVKDGWEDAIEKFNRRYGKQNQSDPNVFRLQNLTNLQRMSRKTLAALAAQGSGNPAALFVGNERKKLSRFVDKLYSLLPQDKDVLDTVPLIMESKPGMSFYVIKSISVRRLDQDEYEKIKARQVYKEDIVQSQSLAIVHFDPENILKRLNFRLIIESEETADTNAPAESEGTS